MLERIRQAATVLCSDIYGPGCRLEAVQELVGPDWGRSTVWRLAMERAEGRSYLIAKLSNLSERHADNEASVLSRIDLDPSLKPSIPQLIGHDEAAVHGAGRQAC